MLRLESDANELSEKPDMMREKKRMVMSVISWLKHVIAPNET